jgi:hypothetical protein
MSSIDTNYLHKSWCDLSQTEECLEGTTYSMRNNWNFGCNCTQPKSYFTKKDNFKDSKKNTKLIKK